MQMRLIPTLVSIMQAPADKIPAGLCAVSASVGHGLGWRCSLFCYTQGGCSAKGRKAAVDVLWSDGFSHWGRFVCGKKANCRCRKMLPKVCFKLLLWPSSSLHSPRPVAGLCQEEKCFCWGICWVPLEPPPPPRATATSQPHRAIQDSCPTPLGDAEGQRMSVTPISEEPPQTRTGLKLWPILAAAANQVSARLRPLPVWD